MTHLRVSPRGSLGWEIGLPIGLNNEDYVHRYVSTRTGALDSLVFGIDVQSGDIRGDAPSFALVEYTGDALERNVVSHRKLLRLIAEKEPAIVATDNVYEVASDKDALVHLLRLLPDTTRLVQVTGDERPEPLSRVASRHGVPYGKDPMQEAEAAARLAARSVGFHVSAFTDQTTVKVSRGRSTGKGGWSEDRYTRRIHGSVRRRTRELKSLFSEEGLDFELDVTEKYGGYSSAVFTVESPPRDIPVSSSRSGDVRVTVEQVRRDGLEFEPLAERHDPVLVGVDPGTTTAVSVVDIDGNVLDVMSTRTGDTASVIEWIVDRGRPVVIAADVTPMPETVEKIKRSFDAAGWKPERDLLVDEKLHRTRSIGYDNDHERDAIAAALHGYDSYAEQLDEIAREVPPRVDLGTVIARVIADGEALEAVIRALTPSVSEEESSSAEPANEVSPEQERITELENRVEQLESYISELTSELEEKNETISSYEDELAEKRREERRDVQERRVVTRLQRENDRLEEEVAAKREQVAALEKKLERLKALWRLDHSNFADIAEEKEGLVPVKPIEQFTVDSIKAADAAYGLAAGDVVFLRDATGAGRKSAVYLAEIEPRVVLRDGGLTDVSDEVLFEHDVPVGPVAEVAIQEIDDLAVARESDVEKVITDWEARADERVRSQNAQMVDRVISEHRAERKET